jgi:adenylate cyclase
LIKGGKLELRDLESFFEGVVPSIIATSSADGIPNVSYLSHVIMVDDDHVGLSNQFFSTTASNLAANPQAAILLVDGVHGGQCRLRATFERTVFEGPLFDRVSAQLDAVSAQVGMGGIMRLRGVDIFRVEEISIYPAPVPATIEPPPHEPLLQAAADLALTLGALAGDLDKALDRTLEWIQATLGCDLAAVFVADRQTKILTTAGSLGYDRSGIGSEIRFGDGLVGSAAARRHIVKISDLSRARRYSAAVHSSLPDENETRTIALPTDPKTMSQIAVPMVANGELQGVLLAESYRRLAFLSVHEAALTLAAQHLAAFLEMSEVSAVENRASAPAAPGHRRDLPQLKVAHYKFDDSVFIGDQYIIKGIAGRLLIHLLRIYLGTGRTEFTNRELRLSPALKLPEFKDNLETRLLLLRRRLADKASPIQLVSSGRGRLILHLEGEPVLTGDAESERP